MAVMAVEPRSPAIEAMLMILPALRGIMQRRATSWLTKNSASTLSRMTLCQPSAGYSSAGAPQEVPALLTRMSMPPKRSITRSTMAGMVSNCDRSPATVSTSTPSPCRWAAASSSSACLRAVMATLAPISPRASAICRPSPREPPVMRATLPVRSNSAFTLIMFASVAVCRCGSAPGQRVERRRFAFGRFRTRPDQRLDLLVGEDIELVALDRLQRHLGDVCGRYPAVLHRIADALLALPARFRHRRRVGKLGGPVAGGIDDGRREIGRREHRDPDVVGARVLEVEHQG